MSYHTVTPIERQVYACDHRFERWGFCAEISKILITTICIEVRISTYDTVLSLMYGTIRNNPKNIITVVVFNTVVKLKIIIRMRVIIRVIIYSEV